MFLNRTSWSTLLHCSPKRQAIEKTSATWFFFFRLLESLAEVVLKIILVFCLILLCRGKFFYLNYMLLHFSCCRVFLLDNTYKGSLITKHLMLQAYFDSFFNSQRIWLEFFMNGHFEQNLCLVSCDLSKVSLDELECVFFWGRFGIHEWKKWRQFAQLRCLAWLLASQIETKLLELSCCHEDTLVNECVLEDVLTSFKFSFEAIAHIWEALCHWLAQSFDD